MLQPFKIIKGLAEVQGNREALFQMRRNEVPRGNGERIAGTRVTNGFKGEWSAQPVVNMGNKLPKEGRGGVSG